MNSETLRVIITAILILLTHAVTAYDIKIDGLCYDIIHGNAYVVYGDKKANSHGLVYDFPNKRNFNGTLEIPAKISYRGTLYNVVGIQDRAFYGCVNLKHVIISEGVRNIGDEAFALCECMETIDIPNSVDYISSSAFYCCWALKSATIPESLVTEEIFFDSIRERLGFEKVSIRKRYADLNDKNQIVKKNEHSLNQSNVAATSKVESPQTQTYVQEKPQQVVQKNVDVTKKRERRIALVIGNSTYDACKRLDNLNCPMKDAQDMHEKLKSLGFEMMPLITDGSEKNMRRRICEFAHKAKEYDVALFFYSGHGIQSSPGFYKTNYLIPSDAKLEYREDIPSQCIDLNELVLNNLSLDSTLSIVLIDACRTTLSLPSKNDLLYNSKGNENELCGLTDIKASGVCVVYAAGTGKRALEPKKEDANSYFTHYVLECLDEDKDRNLLDFVYKVKNKVKKATNDKQNPAIYNETDGTFYFNPNK